METRLSAVGIREWTRMGLSDPRSESCRTVHWLNAES